MSQDQKEVFLNETYSRVESIVGPERAAQLYVELRGHLESRQSEFESRGLDQSLARHAALQSMGTPREIAAECAKQSITEPWLTWPIWIFGFALLCYLFLRSSPSQDAFVIFMATAMPLLLIAGFKNRAAFPLKPLLLSALFVGGVMCFIEAKSVRLWSDRIPYQTARDDFQSMQKNHAKYLAVESQAAIEHKLMLGKVIDQELHKGSTVNLAMHSVNISFLDYQTDFEFARIARGGVAGRFARVPVLTSKRYSLDVARAVIEEKLGTMRDEQRRRRGQMNWVGVLLNRPAFNRMVDGMPYVALAIGGIFGGAYLVSLAGATLGIAAVTRRRRIFG